jgi:hypothetical protein
MQMSYFECSRLGTIAQNLRYLIDKSGAATFPCGLETTPTPLALVAPHQAKEEAVAAKIPDDTGDGLLQALYRIRGNVAAAEPFDERVEALHHHSEIQGLLILEVAIKGALPHGRLSCNILHEHFVEALLGELMLSSAHDRLASSRLRWGGSFYHIQMHV